MNELIELRGRQERKLRKSVDEDTVREIRKRLKRASDDFDPEACRDPLAVAREMLGRIRHEGSPLTEALLHRYRILSKRARYAAEFANPSTEAEQFIAGLKRIQDALGDWHDWLTLTNSARDNLGDVRESSLVAELHNVSGAKFRHAVSVLSQMRPKLISDQASAAAPTSARVPTKVMHESVPAA
jgi:CHAD domain-containing protein